MNEKVQSFLTDIRLISIFALDSIKYYWWFRLMMGHHLHTVKLKYWLAMFQA